MKYRVILEAPAMKDIEAIFLWGVEAWGAQRARRWYEGVSEAIGALAAFPKSHPVAPDTGSFSQEIRQMMFQRYRVLSGVCTYRNGSYRRLQLPDEEFQSGFFFPSFGQPSVGRFFFSAVSIASSHSPSILTISGFGPVFDNNLDGFLFFCICFYYHILYLKESFHTRKRLTTSKTYHITIHIGGDFYEIRKAWRDNNI